MIDRVGATDRFRSIAVQPDNGNWLGHAMAAIAAHITPDFTVETYQSMLAEVGGEFRSHSPQHFIEHLVETSRFRGCSQEIYHTPDASMMPWVLRRRQGIPVSLAIAAIEIGQIQGHEFVGIGMPGHFLLREKNDPTMFYDLFAGARPMNGADCEAMFVSRRTSVPFRAEFLAPVSHHQIIVRVLSNLQFCYESTPDVRNLAWVMELLHLLKALPPAHFERLAKFMGGAGRFADAAAMYDRAGKTHDATRIRAFLN